VTIFISEISGGPPRKYYSITEAGRNKYKTEAKEWLEFSETIRKMLGGEKHD
jgi:PadR family transcriptional regulator PadR